MKDVLLSNAGVQVYIIDGSRRTDAAARAVITALYNAGRVCKEAAERAWSDRATLDKIKKYMIHCKMETRATETGDRWTFYTKTGVFMDIEAYSRNYITADASGNLYPTEAPTEPETSEGKEDTTTPENEPENGTQATKSTDMETFMKEYSRIYNHLYKHEGQPGVDATRRKYSRLFDESWEDIKDIVKAFCQKSGDILTSDRECAAFMKALETVGTPTDGKTAADGETTTTTETDAQRATETPRKTIRTGERLYSHPHRHMVTVAGMQDGLVMVVYCGRLYLVSRADLYTDETETTPAILPTAATQTAQDAPQGTEDTTSGQTTTDGEKTPYSATDEATNGKTITGSRTDGGNRITAPPRHACENAPQRTERVQAVPTTTPRHKTPSRGKYKATHARTPKFGKVCARIRVPSGALFSAGAG